MRLTRSSELLLLAVFTLLLHAPFLNQPVQGDEPHYLDMAREVLRQPLTPLNFQYVFQGRVVDALGHPHPPLNAYLLAIAWMLRGHFSVLFFHAFYLLFALGISFAAYALAARFTAQALWAALLVAASPIVQVNTNTLAGPESPALALLLAGAAAFFWRRFWLCGIALALAGLTELQALAMPPILLLDYVVRRERPPRAAWLALSAPFLALTGWQGFEWGMTHRLPGAVLFGYVQAPSHGGLAVKAASAFALLQHLGVLVTVAPLARRRLWSVIPGLLAAAVVPGYPWWERALLLIFVTLGVNALVWLWNAWRKEPVLAGWCLLYFAFAAVAFFAGAARYLLPLVAPMVLLFVLEFHHRSRWLAAALAVNVVLGLNISFAAYEFARVYAEVPPPPGPTSRSSGPLPPPAPAPAYLVNGEWGFRHYMLAHGGRMLETTSVPRPGEWIVTSDLSLAGNYGSLAEAIAVPLRTVDLPVRTPLRVIDRYAHTGFSSVSFGLLPFSFSRRPLDRVTYSRTSPFLDVPGPWTPTQFSGHLAYLPAPGAAIHLPLDEQGSLHFALFARGRGHVVFSIRRPSGEPMFEQSVQVDENLWEPHTLPLAGTREAILSVDAPPAVRAGWGGLVPDGPAMTAGPQAAAPELSYLNLADLRTQRQLHSGWFAIEDGAWRWMAQQAEATLHRPTDIPLTFQMDLFFPPDYMQRAGGPVTVSVMLDDKPLGEETYEQPGGYHFSKPVPHDLSASPLTRVTIRLNRALPPSGFDQRELGAVVQRLGFVVVK